MESISILGTVRRESEARAGVTLALDSAEETAFGTERTITLPNGMVAVQTISLDGAADVDTVIVKTPRPVLLTLTHATAVVTDMPIRGLAIIQTDGITGVALRNEGNEPILVTVILSKSAT